MNKIEYKIVDGKKSGFNYLKEIVDTRYVLYEFFKRDIKVVYAQSIFGPLFYILLPIFQTGVFNFFINKISSNTVDFTTSFLIIFINMVFWNLFSGNVVKGCSVLMSQKKLIDKVYIPRLIFFISPYLVSLLHFLIQFVFFIILLFFFKVNSDQIFLNLTYIAKWIVVIPLLLYCFILYSSLAIIISMLSLRYRDIVHLVSYIIQLGLFVSPVLYSLNDLSGVSLILVGINPYSLIPEITRWIFFENILNYNFILTNLITALSLFLIAIYLFLKKEKDIADLV